MQIYSELNKRDEWNFYPESELSEANLTTGGSNEAELQKPVLTACPDKCREVRGALVPIARDQPSTRLCLRPFSSSQPIQCFFSNLIIPIHFSA